VQGGPSFPHPADPGEALAALVEGNRRHQEGRLELRDHSPVGEKRATEQQPFAAIISCADSRVSPTLIFDLEPGNIFVSKVAGNSIDAGTLGSTEYAIALLGVRLVLVLGHSDCGAVKAAIEVAGGATSYPADTHGAIGEIVDRVVPPIRDLPPAERTLARCVTANARAQADDLASRGPIVDQALASGQIAVASGVYDIGTRQVSLI
jgi:carbonic anhydrase